MHLSGGKVGVLWAQILPWRSRYLMQRNMVGNFGRIGRDIGRQSRFFFCAVRLYRELVFSEALAMRRIPMLLGLTVSVLLPKPLWAQMTAAPELRACAAIADPGARLSCYDRLAGRAVPSSAAPIPQPPLPPPPTQAADFGADTLPQAQPAPIARSRLESITAVVTDISFDPKGHFTVTLSNGQMWRQIEGDTVNVPLKKDLTRTATISRAILWSYSIRFNNPRGLFKVVRVQ
jgi:hypothetical protein